MIGTVMSFVHVCHLWFQAWKMLCAWFFCTDYTQMSVVAHALKPRPACKVVL
jgi:hypothetical protein